MIVYIIRHAAAAERNAAEWPNDELRPLTPKGAKRFRRLVKRLLQKGFSPARIATSPLVRCRQTAQLLFDRMGDETSLDVLPELAPGARASDLLFWLCEGSADEIAIVGHAPDVGDLLATFIGAKGASFDFAKGAIAAVEFDGKPDVGTGSLRWLLSPRMV